MSISAKTQTNLPNPGTRSLMGRFRLRNIWFVILLGIIIFIFSIAEIGYGRFLHLISNVNKSLIPLIILLNILNSIAFTISWKILIQMNISFYKLFRFYIIGTSINNITPSLGSGGEPVKAVLLGNETGRSKAECFAGVVSNRIVNVFSFLIIEFAGIGLLLYRPEPNLNLERWQIFALVSSVLFSFSIFGLLAYFYARKDKLFSFVNLIVRVFAPLIRFVKRDFDHTIYADAIERSIDLFHGGLKNIHGNKKGLASAIFISTFGWIFDIITIYVVFLSLGSGIQINASILIITYVISIISGWLPLFLPGGLGVVDSTMAALFILNGMPLGIALLATLLYRLASYWFNTILGAFYLLRSIN